MSIKCSGSYIFVHNKNPNLLFGSIKIQIDCLLITYFVMMIIPSIIQWVIMQHACAAYGYTIVPIYPTFGNEAMQHILSQSEFFHFTELILTFYLTIFFLY